MRTASKLILLSVIILLAPTLVTHVVLCVFIRTWLVWLTVSVTLQYSLNLHHQKMFIKIQVQSSYLLHYVCSWDMRAFSIPTGPDQLPLSEVKEAIKELQSEWYSIAVELEISHSVRKVGMVTDHL